MRAVVVGGGITGLAAAHRLLERARGASRQMDLTVVEASERIGGAIRTTRESTPAGEILVEWGADAFFTEKPWASELAKRIDLGVKFIEPRSEPGLRRALILHHGQLEPIPEGFQLLAPTALGPIFRTRILTATAKLRMALEPLVRRRKIKEGEEVDESLGAFVRRRLGRECLERLAQPLIGGIYGADPERLSLEATMPRFVEMERSFGSVIRGLRATRREQEASAGARYGLFTSFEGGMQTLPDALMERIGPERIRTKTAATSLRRTNCWEIILDTGELLRAEVLLIALPAPRAAPLLAALDDRLASEIRTIRSTSSAIVTMAWWRGEVAHPLDAFGFVVPAIEQRPLIAGTFSSTKFTNRAPGGVALLRAFFGAEEQTRLAGLSDAGLQALARSEFGELLGIDAEPIFAAVHRHPEGMPQYDLGHRRRIASIRFAVARHPGLALAGNWLKGVGIPDCVRSAESAADALFDLPEKRGNVQPRSS